MSGNPGQSTLNRNNGTELIVMKFGGSSVANADRLRNVAELIHRQCTVSSNILPLAESAQPPANAGSNLPAGRRILVVLSAFSGVTDSLLRCGNLASSGQLPMAVGLLDQLIDRHQQTARQLLSIVPDHLEKLFSEMRSELRDILQGAALLRHLPDRSLDTLVSKGELLSSAILAAYMQVRWFDARSVMLTDGVAGKARPDYAAIRQACDRELASVFAEHQIIVTQGFIGSDASGNTVTLGRGGSDFSASIFGAALQASEIQIWTDVEGVLTGDPRIIPEASPVLELAFDEAAELAAFGAKVLHPSTILPAIENDILVTVRNSLQPDSRMTAISRQLSSGRAVSAIACRGPLSVITVETPRMLGGTGFLSRIFEIFGRHKISVDVVATSEISVSATVDADAQLGSLLPELSAIGTVSIVRDKALISLVGELMPLTPGVAATAFNALCDTNIDMISYGANRINLSFVLAHSAAADAQRRLHQAFFPTCRVELVC